MASYLLTGKEEKAIEEWLGFKGLPLGHAVTFGDVTSPENYSGIRSRSEIKDFSSRLLPDLTLGIPITSANMESVSGSELIIELQRLGGLGFIPQSLPLENKLEVLEEISRADCAYHEKPFTVLPHKTREELDNTARKRGVFSFVVIDKDRRVAGICSKRDWLYERDPSRRARELMGGGRLRPLVTAPRGTTPEEASLILREQRIEKLPVVTKSGKLLGLYTANGIFYKESHPRALRGPNGQFVRVGSVGVGKQLTKEKLREVAAQVEKGGAVAILVDTARAFSANTAETLRALKKKFPRLRLIVGNVSTPEGAKFLIENGADSVKVGQGPGHACRTREVGVGIPQLTATAKCAALARFYGKTVIADGGMRSPGDIAHALSAGAEAVMLGFLLAGTRESAASHYLDKYGEYDLAFKDYEGSASFHAQLRRVRRGDLDGLRRPEGVKEKVPVTGTLEEKISGILAGLASRMSYVGAKNLKEFREKDKFVLQTGAGFHEGVKR